MNKRQLAALQKKIDSHEHHWVPLLTWGSYGDATLYSMELGCACGGFKIIDSLEVKDGVE